MKKKLPLTVPNFAGYFLLAAIIVLLYFLYVIYTPFFTSLIFAVIFATIFSPIFRRLKKLFWGHARIASILTCLLTLLIIAIPLAFFITLLAIEGYNAFTDIATKIQSGFFNDYFSWWQDWWQEGNFFYDQFQQFYPLIQEKFSTDVFNLDFLGKISETAQNLGETIVSNVSNFVANFFWFLFALVIFFFSLYYFLKDGDMIVAKIGDLSPLPEKHEKAIFKKFKEVSLAMLFGIFFTAVIQGTLAGIGYAVVGMPNPIFWAAATALFSLVPLFGTAIIWVPASIILIIIGNFVGGIGLFLWGVLVVGTVDNFIRPYLIEGRAPVHPLLTFLAVLGGIFAFNLKGIIFGPLILNLLLAFLHIYEKEYAKVLKN